uniref:Endonuclease/exonuclease/phosphatase domain-containing protein n=1 Tax=Pipistrellus kuhlii TaxID=59472 RepID=A0A7J7ZJ72_PIPKU|nr:hypothetical protein mPipKuh1_009538 [Pipistrellus kuhlii]
MSNKLDLTVKKITMEKKVHFLVLKGAIQQEEITLINKYVPNTGAPKYIKILLESSYTEIDTNTILVGDFNTPLKPLGKSSKQKISKEMSILNDSLDQTKLIDIFRTFYPKATEYRFFSSSLGSFSKINHILGHRQHLLKFKEIEILLSIFSDQKANKTKTNKQTNKP